MCAPQRRRMQQHMQQQRQRANAHDEFFKQLEQADDGFSKISEYFGAGMFGASASRWRPRAGSWGRVTLTNSKNRLRFAGVPARSSMADGERKHAHLSERSQVHPHRRIQQLSVLRRDVPTPSTVRASWFREIFNLVDLDKGGTINKDELKQLMNTLRLKPSRCRPAVPGALLQKR